MEWKWRSCHTQLLAGPAGMVYLILGFQPQPCFNGDGEQLPGVGVAPMLLLTKGLRALAMENGEGCVAPAARGSGQVLT